MLEPTGFSGVVKKLTEVVAFGTSPQRSTVRVCGEQDAPSRIDFIQVSGLQAVRMNEKLNITG